MIFPFDPGSARTRSPDGIVRCGCRRLNAANETGRIAGDDCVRRDVLEHYGPGTDHCSFSNGDTRKNARVESDPHISPDVNRARLISARRQMSRAQRHSLYQAPARRRTPWKSLDMHNIDIPAYERA